MEYDIPSYSSPCLHLSPWAVMSSYSISQYPLQLALLFLNTLSSSFMKTFQSCPNWSSFFSFCIIHLTYLNQITFSKTLCKSLPQSCYCLQRILQETLNAIRLDTVSQGLPRASTLWFRDSDCECEEAAPSSSFCPPIPQGPISPQPAWSVIAQLHCYFLGDFVSSCASLWYSAPFLLETVSWF